MLPWTAATQVGPYLLVSLIGAGGMGEVWKARDTRLDRMVAIKRLTGRHSARFEQEARSIAALNHPYICTLHDVGPDYLVMEYVEGEPLRGPLPPEDALRLARQIAEALDEAHSKGVIHRDLKPDNILKTRSGIKVLDFGLAKLIAAEDSDATRTIEGTVVGTAAYMSPEQAQGRPVDARSDIFSFGLVLYELLSGHRAFAGETSLAAMAAILHQEPEPLEAPAKIGQIITRCLRKAPAERFQTIADVRIALEKIGAKPGDQQPSIAVLPFTNMSGDKENEYFSDGLAEEIINVLAQVPGLKVTARTSAFAFRGKEQDITKIAEALHVRTILEGSVRRSGNRIRVTAQLINAEDGYHLWSERYDREMADVFALQDEIAAAIVGALKMRLAVKPAEVRPHTPSLAAYEAFLKGRHHLFQSRPESLARAKEYFEQAITLDPDFAEPHAEMGSSYTVLGMLGLLSAKEALPLARAEARKALALCPDEPRACAVLAMVAVFFECDWKEAEDQFRRAMAADPVPPEVHGRYAMYLFVRGRFSQAMDEIEKTLEQDPLNILWRGFYAHILNAMGMYSQAMEQAREVIEIDERHWGPPFGVAASYALQGKFTEAREFAEKAQQLAPWNSAAAGLLAGIYARTGNRQGAESLLGHMKPAGRVVYHTLCSELDLAAEWYKKAVEQGEFIGLVISTNLLKPLRDSSRWPALAKMTNLPESG